VTRDNGALQRREQCEVPFCSKAVDALLNDEPIGNPLDAIERALLEI
jgi:hypothetical protein